MSDSRVPTPQKISQGAATILWGTEPRKRLDKMRRLNSQRDGLSVKRQQTQYYTSTNSLWTNNKKRGRNQDWDGRVLQVGTYIVTAQLKLLERFII